MSEPDQALGTVITDGVVLFGESPACQDQDRHMIFCEETLLSDVDQIEQTVATRKIEFKKGRKPKQPTKQKESKKENQRYNSSVIISPLKSNISKQPINKAYHDNLLNELDMNTQM